MRRHKILAPGLGIVFLGAVGLTSSPALGLEFLFQKDDRNVCYRVDRTIQLFPSVIRLNVKEHSRLTMKKEKSKHYHPIQTTYTALGKQVLSLGDQPAADINLNSNEGHFSMSNVDGSVIVAKKVGARMGLTVRTLLIGDEAIHPLNTTHLDCSSTESSATPGQWDCHGQEISLENGSNNVAARLVQIDPLENPLCSIFELGILPF